MPNPTPAAPRTAPAPRAAAAPAPASAPIGFVGTLPDGDPRYGATGRSIAAALRDARSLWGPAVPIRIFHAATGALVASYGPDVDPAALEATADAR